MTTYLHALGLSVPMEVAGQWLLLVPVLALELGSAFAMVLVHAMVPMMVTNSRGSERSTVVALHRRQQSRTQTQQLIAKMILDRLIDQGGALRDTERNLARAFGTSKPTVRRSLHQLTTDGKVRVTAGRRGTFVQLMEFDHKS